MKPFLATIAAILFVVGSLPAFAQIKDLVNGPVTFFDGGATPSQIEEALEICEAVLPDDRKLANGGPGCVVDYIGPPDRLQTIVVRPGAIIEKLPGL